MFSDTAAQWAKKLSTHISVIGVFVGFAAKHYGLDPEAIMNLLMGVLALVPIAVSIKQPKIKG